MKKSLIALAVAGVVAAPAAFAATSNVDIYGKLHVSWSWLDDQVSSADEIQVSSNASRIGFKGTEDLGGGLKAVWQLESGIDLDEQTGTLASRNSFLGLSGNWGTALIGNHDTPLKLVGRAVDLFGDTLADSRNVLGGGSDTRADNVVAYISPNFSGFSFAAAWANDITDASTNGDATDDAAWNVNASYSNGPLYLGVGYGDGDHHENAGLGSHWRVAGSYAFGDFKIVGQYDNLEGNTAGAYTKGDMDGWLVGGAFTMGPMVFKANYMEAEYDNALDTEQWTVGMDYNLSKRTSVYVLYVDGQNITLGGGAASSDRIAGGAATGDKDISAISLGLVHNF